MASSMLPVSGLKIVAPVNDPAEVSLVAAAGADEIYCGALLPEWQAAYGDSDTISRRQGCFANVTSMAAMLEIAREAERAGMAAALTVNVSYTREQLPLVLKLAETWHCAGGGALLVCDLSLMFALKRQFPDLLLHLSIMAAVFNSSAVQFYRDFGVSRVVLPRALTIGEMADISARCPGVEFEVMALNEKCEFIDGLCGFYHGTSFPPGTASYFSYFAEDGRQVTYAHDLAYAGHGCQIPFRTPSGRGLSHMQRDDVSRPHCAACYLHDLAQAGIGLLKIGGRGLPIELKVRAVRFLRDAKQVAIARSKGWRMKRAVKKLYKRTFGKNCSHQRCYYRL